MNKELVRIDQITNQFDKWGVTITRYAMIFEKDLTDEQMEQIGQALMDTQQRLDTFLAYLVADWMNQMPWGEKRDTIAKSFGDGFYHKARKVAAVFRRFPVEWRERYSDVKLGTWVELTSASTDTAQKLLQQAQYQNGAISRQHIRDVIQAEKFPLAPADPDKVNAMLSKGSGGGGVSAGRPQSGTLDWENDNDQNAKEDVPAAIHAPHAPQSPTGNEDAQTEPTDFEQICVPNATMAQLREIARHWSRKHHKPYRPEDVLVSLAATVYEQMQERG